MWWNKQLVCISQYTIRESFTIHYPHENVSVSLGQMLHQIELGLVSRM
jgi:hypothetical protein